TRYREVTLPQLNALLADVLLSNDNRQKVRDAIKYQLQNIFDYEDAQRSLVEEKPLLGQDGKPVLNTEYLRVRHDLRPRYKDESGVVQPFPLRGIIMGGTTTVLRTDSVVVDAALGLGECLDSYSRILRAEAGQ